jgi:hypothetical protein
MAESQIFLPGIERSSWSFADSSSTVDSFHLPGKHDQRSHGHGFRSTLTAQVAQEDVDAGVLLNSGKNLPQSPATIELQGAISAWVETNPGLSKDELDKQIEQSYDDPGGMTPGARLTRTVAAAPSVDSPLYRGLHDVPENQLPKVGDEFTLGVTSFTSNQDIAEEFSQAVDVDHPVNSVMMIVQPGSRALDISQHTGDYSIQEEHLAVGTYRVTKRKQGETTLELAPSDDLFAEPEDVDVAWVDLEVEQIA